MKMTDENLTRNLLLFLIFLAASAMACGDGMESQNTIESRRFLAIVADPLEAGYGETVNFFALVSESNGKIYDGPVNWSISRDDSPDDSGLSLDFSSEAGGEATWEIPAKSELSSLLGPPEIKGYLLRATMTTAEGEHVEAYKRFVVSERDAADRIANPVIENMELGSGGEALEAGGDGTYATSRNEVTLTAQTSGNEDDLFFEWYSTRSDFEPDHDAAQTFEPGKNGTWTMYCVIREELEFEHDNSSVTTLAGIDWWRGVIEFQ